MVFIGCISPMLMASDSLEGSVSYGFDSNPYKLSSPDGLQRNREYKALQFEYQGDSLVGDLEGSLVGNQLKSSRKKANLLYRLKLNKRVYNASSSAADSSRVDGHLRWIERFKLG
ncbi:MAG: hypothetical protein P8H31_09410, partial [Porticoccaceae bacterium]|nr:hypothetical protein [Porticoccaceae bacterium]